MMPLVDDSHGGVGNSLWNQPTTPTFFDLQSSLFKVPGDQLDDSSSSSSGEKGERPNPSRYKTELCRPFEENGACKYGEKCQFAHGRTELRNLNRHPKYKTELCRTFHTTGICPYGPRCHFLHAEALEAAAASASSAAVAAKLGGVSSVVDSGIVLNDSNNNDGGFSSKNHPHQQQQQHQHSSFLSRSNSYGGSSSNHNSGDDAYNNFSNFASASSSSSSSVAATPRPSNLDLGFCPNGVAMNEGEISPPSTSSSSASYSSGNNNPLILSLSSSSGFASSASSSSSSSVWGPSPAPMSPSSSVSSFSTSSCLSGEGPSMDRPASATSPTSSYLQIPAPFAPTAATASSSIDFLSLARDFAANGASVSPPPVTRYPETRSGTASTLNPAAESWTARAANNFGGPLAPVKHQQQPPPQSFHSERGIQRQQRCDLLLNLGGGANFDRLSKMIVNELLERLKEMIANQIAGAPPHVQQQALLEQIQALLTGGGISTTMGGGGHRNSAPKAQRGARNRWGSDVRSTDGESLVDSMRGAFDQNVADFRSLSSKPASNDVEKGVSSLLSSSHEARSNAKDIVAAGGVEDSGDEDGVVRLPIFSQLTK